MLLCHLLSPVLGFHLLCAAHSLPSIRLPLSRSYPNEVGSSAALGRLWWETDVSKGQLSLTPSRLGGWDGSGPLFAALPPLPIPDSKLEAADRGLASGAESLLFAESKNRNLLLFLCTTKKNPSK